MLATSTAAPASASRYGGLRHAGELLYLLTKRELKLRYQDTVLGFVWTAMKPLVLGLVIWFAIHRAIGVKTEAPYHIFLLSALLPWTLFQTSLLLSTPLFAHNGNLVKKVPFPAAVLPMATIANNLIHFLLSIPVLVAFLLLAGRTPGWQWIIGVPLLLGVQVTLMVGCALFLSAVDVFFRDLEHLIEVLLTLLFYVTPVLYPLASVPQPYRDLFRLNPIVPLIDAWRRLFLDNELPGANDLPGLAMTTVIVVLGAWVFSSLRPVFADHL